MIRDRGMGEDIGYMEGTETKQQDASSQSRERFSFMHFGGTIDPTTF